MHVPAVSAIGMQTDAARERKRKVQCQKRVADEVHPSSARAARIRNLISVFPLPGYRPGTKQIFRTGAENLFLAATQLGKSAPTATYRKCSCAARATGAPGKA